MPTGTELAGRDVVVLPLGDGRLIVQAVDVAVGIGPKPGDAIPAAMLDVGYAVTRTAASELWSLGAAPAVAAVTIGDRRAADRVLEGVDAAFEEMGLAVPRVRSTENYVEAAVSSVSVAVSGVIDEDALLLGEVRAGHQILVLGGGYRPGAGDPQVGRWPLAALAVLFEQRRHLVQVVPVGSGGIERDLEDLRRRHGLVLVGTGPAQDLRRPGGPGLQFLVIADGPVGGPHLARLGDLRPDPRP
jgi:hypothetical protein